MIPIQTLKVASPCHADWDEMQGDDQVRFCQSCRKNVYNLSEMTGDEAQALVNRLEGRLCVRFYTRADGTLLTQDCPVGLAAVRRKLVKKLSYAAAVLLSCASGLLRWTGTAQAVTVGKPPASGAQMAVRPPKPILKCIAGAVSGLLPRPHPTMGAPLAVPPAPASAAKSQTRPAHEQVDGKGKRAPHRHSMGKVALPRLKADNPAVGPDPFALPRPIGPATMGRVRRPAAPAPPTMGMTKKQAAPALPVMGLIALAPPPAPKP